MGRFTDRRERFEEVIREMGVFTDGRCHLVGFVREKGGFADRGISESRIHQSQNPGILFLNHFVQPEMTLLSAGSTRYGRLAMHILMAAYFAHLLARTVYLSVRYRKTVLG